MAIVKHLTSKNRNYGDSVNYLTQQYDEKLNKPILDKQGGLQEREAYLISYVRSDGSAGDVEDWNRDCNMINTKYKQNRADGDIRTHHYIIAFEDKDNISLEDTQKFGKDVAAEMFKGNNYLVAAHPGHVHVIVNSVRDREREQAAYMAKNESGSVKKYEYEAGKKHNCSQKFLHHMKSRVMELCRERGFSQSVDLNQPAKAKKSDKEYKAEQNAAKEGKITQKEYIRRAIEQAKASAKTPEQYISVLKELGVEMQRRGKSIRYKTSAGEKWIRDKSLGTDYELESIVKSLQIEPQRSNYNTLDSKIRSGADRTQPRQHQNQQHRSQSR